MGTAVRSMRRILLAASFLVWVLMMCLLFRRHVAASASEGPGPVLALARRAPFAPVWYGLYHGAQKIGWGRVAADADAEGDAVRCRLSVEARLALPETASFRGEATVRDPGGLSEFFAEARAAAGVFTARGTVRGSELLLDWRGGPANGAADVKLSSAAQAGRPAGSARLPLSDLGGSGIEVRDVGEEVLNVTGVLIPAREYRVVTRAGEARVWAGADGGVVRAEAPGGYAAVREPRALAERAVR